VTLSVPWLVRGAHAVQDAINIAVSEVGARVSEADSPHVDYCDISTQTRSCTTCGTPIEAVLVVAETAIVAGCSGSDTTTTTIDLIRRSMAERPAEGVPN
jgi:uncharacterized protein (UPF0212 family)